MFDFVSDSFLERLAGNAHRWNSVDAWPQDSLQLCGQNGIFVGLSGLAESAPGNRTWSRAEQIQSFIQLAKADLLTTFVITQHLGAIKRILGSDALAETADGGGRIRDKVLPELLSGKQIGSVGISHLTTSRQHLGRPAVLAKPVPGGFRISGNIPWVTGASKVEQMVVGASLGDESQVLLLVPPNLDGVRPGKGAEMIAMSASCTDAVELNNVFVPDDLVLAGPRENVLAGQNKSPDAPSGAGGLQTSALALGLSYAALDYLRGESIKRKNLIPIVDRFNSEHESLHQTILSEASGDSDTDAGLIRTTANGLVQRTTSAAMTTAKGAGLMIDHPVGRWCQQAFFFLVWSCPQPVAEAHLCELVDLT